MIHLMQIPCSQSLLPTLHQAAEQLGAVQAVMLSTGPGPWDCILPWHDEPVAMFAFRLANGELRTAAALDIIAAPEKLALTTAVSQIYNEFHRHQGLNIGGGCCAIILRKHAYLLMTRGACNRYVPLANGSGHELMNDPVELEREFPGIFRIT